MPYAFLNTNGDVLGLSSTDISLATYQTDFDPTATERIVGAPDGLITKYRAGKWGNPDWYSRKTSGDGTHIDDYSNIDVPPVYDLPLTPVEIKNAVFEQDGKQVIVPTPAPLHSYTWYTSKGDVLDPIARGEGTSARITYDASETGVKTVELVFAEAVYIHDGEFSWNPVAEFDGTDYFSIYIGFNATSITPNPGGTGNCTLVDGYIIIPAAGNGDYDVDLSAAVPIPDNSGPWVVNEKTEEIKVYTDDSSLNLYDKRIVLLLVAPDPIYLVRNVNLGSPRGIFEIDAYLVEWMSRHWKLGMEVSKTKSPASAVEINALAMLFRWSATSNGAV